LPGEGFCEKKFLKNPPAKQEIGMSKIQQWCYLSRKYKLNIKKFSLLLQFKIIIVYYNIILVAID